jgi:hypothetical protein
LLSSDPADRPWVVDRLNDIHTAVTTLARYLDDADDVSEEQIEEWKVKVQNEVRKLCNGCVFRRELTNTFRGEDIATNMPTRETVYVPCPVLDNYRAALDEQRQTAAEQARATDGRPISIATLRTKSGSTSFFMASAFLGILDISSEVIGTPLWTGKALEGFYQRHDLVKQTTKFTPQRYAPAQDPRSSHPLRNSLPRDSLGRWLRPPHSER